MMGKIWKEMSENCDNDDKFDDTLRVHSDIDRINFLFHFSRIFMSDKMFTLRLGNISRRYTFKLMSDQWSKHLSIVVNWRSSTGHETHLWMREIKRAVVGYCSKMMMNGWNSFSFDILLQKYLVRAESLKGDGIRVIIDSEISPPRRLSELLLRSEIEYGEKICVI